MNWYYLKGGSWIGPLPDEEKRDLMDWGVYPRPEEDFFGDFSKQDNEINWRNESDESEDYVEDWRYDPEEEDEEEETYTETAYEKEIEEENVEENKMSKYWKEEKEEKVEDLKAPGEGKEKDEDDLAVRDDDPVFWDFLKNYSNDENFRKEDDELAVKDSKDERRDDDSESEDFSEDELAKPREEGVEEVDYDSGVSDEQKDDLTSRLDTQEERLKSIDDRLETMVQKLGALVTICRRLDSLEEKAKASTENYEKLDANLQSISVRVDACEINDYKTLLDAQDERLQSVEEQIEQVSQDIDGFLEDNEDRLDTLEERTETFDKTCEKITADVQALSVRSPAFNVDAWKIRFDDQAEDLAILREQITGIERKVNGETEERNRRLDALEEKTNKYEVVSRDVGAKVDSFETTIQNLGKSVRALDSLSKRVDALQRERETFDITNPGLPALKRSVDNLESKASAFQTRFDSFERETNNADFIYEARFAKLEQTSNSFEARIQNLQNAVERNGSNSASLPDIEEIIAELQNKGVPAETRVKKLEAASACFKSSLEAQEQLLLEQTRNLSNTINSQTTVLTGQIEQTQAQVKSLETSVQRLTEDSVGTALIGRINQLITKFQKQNKETQEEWRKLKEYVDDQRQTIEKLVDDIARKATTSASQEPYKVDEQEETMGTAFIGRITQLVAKLQKQNKELQDEQEEERRRLKEYVDERYRAIESLVGGSKKKWRLF